jgi:uncharacterized protein
VTQIRSRRRAVFVAATATAMTATLACVAPATAHAQAAPYYFAYVMGTDTVGAEIVRVDDAGIGGSLRMRGQPRVEWRHLAGPAGPGALTLEVFAPTAAEGAAPLQAFTFTPRGDSMVVETTANGATRTQVAVSRAGAVPVMGQSVSHMAFLTFLSRSMNRPSFPAFLTSGGQTFDVTVRTAGDTSEITLAGTMARVLWRGDAPSEMQVPSQNLRVVRVPSLPGVLPPERVSYDAPADAPYTSEHVTIPTSRGYTLAGTLTRPKGVTGKVPVLVTISGSGPQDRDSRISMVRGYAPFRDIADTLGRRGIAVLRYDDRGVGESGGAASRDNATSEDFADDVLSVVAYLRTRPEVDGARILLAGHSEGGLIAPIAAVKDPQIRAVAILAGPSIDGRRILMYQNENGIKAAPIPEAQRDSLRRTVPATLDSLQRSNRWMRYFMTADPLVMARRVKQPVLVLQGDTDMQVTPEQADQLAAAIRAAGNRRVTVKRFPETNHLFLRDASGAPQGYAALPEKRVRPEVLGALAEWVAQTVR